MQNAECGMRNAECRMQNAWALNTLIDNRCHIKLLSAQAFRIPHSAFRIQNSAFRILHSAFKTPYFR